jgi:hypothetical protein
MKNKRRLFLALIPVAFTFSFARALGEDQQFTASLDGLLSGAFSSAPGGPGFSGGLGAAAFGDWRPVPFLSLGTGLDFTEHPGGAWQTSSWSLGGRLFPLPMEKNGEWYLQGTAGLNLITDGLDKRWPGNFHGTAGPGYRLFMGKGTALDLGVQYDFFSPVHSPLQALGLKAGWTWLFGKVPTPPPTVSPLPSGPAAALSAPATAQPGPAGKNKKKKKNRPTPTPTPVKDPYLKL